MSRQSELDEIILRLARYANTLTPHKLNVPVDPLTADALAETKQAILDWHNKQIEKAVSADEFLNYLFRNGYVDREWDAEELEGTLNKLKGEL